MSYKVNWKNLTGKDKLEYVWEYYRIPIVLIACVLIFISSMWVKFSTESDQLLNLLMINSNLSEAPSQNSFQEFFEENGYQLFENAVECNISLNFTAGKDQRDHEILNMENYQLLSTWILSGDYDVFLGTGEPFSNIAKQGALMDLSEILSEDTLNKYEDVMLYVDKDGKIEPYPCAVYIKDHRWLSENGGYEECYLGILKGGQNQDAAIKFVEYLLGQ